MIAFLGMYDPPPLRAANDRFWQAIRAQLDNGPARLTRDGDVWDIWTAPDLLLAQTCGYPYRARLHGQVQLVGTPDYGLEGCPPGHYHSVLIVNADSPAERPEDLSGRVFAYNEPLSQSGWAAPMTHLTGRVRFGRLLQTGAHAASARAVAEGRAEAAALDALTWDLLREHDPVAGRLRVLERTAPTPGLPYITAKGRDAAAVAAAIRAAISGLDAADRTALHLKGLADIPSAAYLAIPSPAGPHEYPA